MPVAPWVWERLCAQLLSPCWDLVWLGLTEILYILWWAYVCISPWYPEDNVSLWSSTLRLLDSFWPLSYVMIPEPWERDWSLCVPFRAEHSAVCLSLCTLASCGSLYSPLSTANTIYNHRMNKSYLQATPKLHITVVIYLKIHTQES